MQPLSPLGFCSWDSRFGRDLGFIGLFASILQTLDLSLREEDAEATPVPVWLVGTICSK